MTNFNLEIKPTAQQDVRNFSGELLDAGYRLEFEYRRIVVDNYVIFIP